MGMVISMGDTLPRDRSSLGSRLGRRRTADAGNCAPFIYGVFVSTSPVSVQEIAFLGTEEVGSSHLDVIAERKYKQTLLQRLYDFLFHEAVHEWIS